MNFFRTLVMTATVLFACRLAPCDDATEIEFFEKQIRPILIRHCYECHSAAASELKGGLRLDSRELIRNGGDSGPAVVPGDTEKSLLLDAIRHESIEMPPDNKLASTVIADFEHWIKIGAPDPRDNAPSADEVAELSWQTVFDERRNWWSLQPVVATTPPGAETNNAIDAFVFAKQQAAGISRAEPETAQALARRLSFVLTGLPPAPSDVENLVADFKTAPDAACESHVDRLLNSPHFGEHWARHWMDVVRFAETHGYEWNHEIRDAWRYRDYLIRAFNNDLPYDQLVREHIAGDLLEEPRVNETLGINESIIGTAFWRFGELGHDDCVEFPEIRFDALDNQIDTFAKAFQGLTLSCARCHDHKLDAMSSKDYYALVGMLESCSQVVHTIDLPQRISPFTEQAQKLKLQTRQRLAASWLSAVDDVQEQIRLTLAGDESEKNNSTPLSRHIANEKLGHEDPGYILGRLARRDIGSERGSLVDTSDLRRAQWLWFPEGNAAINAPIESRYFRRTINLPANRRVTQAWCLFSGDDSVSFYINGTPVGRQEGHTSLYAADISDKLMSGANELAVVNTNGNPSVQPNPGGWIGVVRVEFNAGDPLLVFSDSNWKCSRESTNGWRTANIDHEWVNAMELGKAGIAPWGYPWPEQTSLRTKADLASVWSSLRDEYVVEHDRRSKFNAENFEVWSDFGPSNTPNWTASGLGLMHGTSRAGEFTLAEDGEHVVASILPAGMHTNLISERLNGSFRSPWLPTTKKYISVQLVGDNRSMVRTVVDTCALNEFAGGGLHYLLGGASEWKRFPTSAGGSHRSFVELTTRADNPRWPDRPDRAGSKDPKELRSHRSYFGVMRAVLHDSPASPLPDLGHAVDLFERQQNEQTVDEATIASSFASAAQNAVIAWKEDRATDADVTWINWLLRVGLLPNSANGDPTLQKLLTRYHEVVAEIPEPRVIAGLADHGKGRAFPVLRSGDPLKPGITVPPRYLEAIADASQPFDSMGSGRRQLAELVASPTNPLTARVMVNRVWHHLFGRGIVATTDDFGHMGEEPTHPQLLDYLAAEFAEDDWSIKRLVRRIVLSKTFRQSSRPFDQSKELDPDNNLLHYYPPHRLSAEAVRDTILAVSGRLDSQLFGPSIHPFRKNEIDYRKLWSGPLDGDGRRSVYTQVTRMEGPQFLELFDFPNPMATRGRRDRTNVPAQALALLNDPFVIDQARVWSERLLTEDHDSVADRVRSMFRKALGREPIEAELQRMLGLIRQLADSAPAGDPAIMQNKSIWQDVAHSIFNMKEFIYIR
ncbi:MAG: PSD1 domain-containing protein [Planctomycetales bacterium]|nr:PSD1 domain-containing protein [Planctomycetales bacterium]